MKTRSKNEKTGSQNPDTVKEILFIAPYEQMYLSAGKILDDAKYQSIQIVQGNLEEGLALAINGVESRMRVVISRGGTYRIIKQANIGIPVVEIRSSPFDLIESLSSAIENDRPLAIVGYSNIINDYDEKYLKKMIKNKLTIINLGDQNDVRQVIAGCARDGYSTFLGDTIVKNVCDEMGYTCYLQESGSSSIQAAMDEALRICSALRQEQELARRLRAVIDFVHDGVIAVDGAEKIILFNTIADNLLGVNQENILGSPIDTLSHLPFFNILKTGDKIVDQPFKIGNQLLSISTIPISMENTFFGSVVVIRDIHELQAYEQKLRITLSDKGFIAKHTFESIIHKNAKIAHCISIAKKFSHYDASILIEGESGVGKELFAQGIHNNGGRQSGPFVAVNCAVLPKSLIESELFGYVEGAFTDSRKGGKAGYFELAHRGTLFLDEISELPLDVQAQLLRVIQEKEVMRLGDTKIVPVDVRLICATNKNLVDMVHQGLFRNDLLFRINTLSLYIPPLTEWREDIDILAVHFLRRFCKVYDKTINGFSPKASSYLRSYFYEGNIRELQSMIERAVIICDENILRLSDLQSGLRLENRKTKSKPQPGNVSGLPVDLETIEEEYIHKTLMANNHSITKTANVLGISRSTLWRKIKKFSF
jgi:PAS domain S-box-containing protein